MSNEPVKEVFIHFVEVERITGQVPTGTTQFTVLDHWRSFFGIFARSKLYYQGPDLYVGPLCNSKLLYQLYSYYAAHLLNLAACRSKNVESYISEVAIFFKFSAG